MTEDTTTTDVAQRPQQQPQNRSVADMLPAMLPEIQRSLPKHMSGDRFTRLVLTEIRKTPRLAECTPESFFGALLTASALGLEPGVNGEAYLVPFKNTKTRSTECELIVGYQGIAKLFWQHPLASRLTAEYVCEKDHFRIQKGLVQALEHEPANGDRGPVVGYWALAELSTGAQVFDYFTADQIRTLRRGKVGSSGDIPDPEHWMERKTALKQVLKLMPKAVQLGAALANDEQVGSLDVGRRVAIQVNDATGEIAEGGEA